jgi:hypothetical protein
MKTIRALLLLAVAATSSSAGETTLSGLAPKRFHCPEMTLSECSRMRMESLHAVARDLRVLAARPVPEGLSPAQKNQLDRFNQWLILTAERTEALASGTANGQQQLMDATKQMQEMQISFNLQYLMLQEAIQNRSRQYETLSDIEKSRADALSAIVANLR